MMKLHNPTNENIRFPWGREQVEVPAGEIIMVDDAVARHCLMDLNNDIVEYSGKPQTNKATQDFSDLSWQELQKLAAKEGVFKSGMKRKDVEEALRNV